MKKILPILFYLGILSGCDSNTPKQIEPTRELADAKAKAMVLCAGCHGSEGIGTADFNPNLACQKKVYLVKQLQYYRDGTRKTHPPMTNIARMLSEEEVETISEWYSITGCPNNKP